MSGPTNGLLGLDDDDLVACVACGLCLPHCPTYRVTGREIASPRGRIAAMRAVERGALPIDGMFLRAIDECVQCRGCEAACPSSVRFGDLMETTRAAAATRAARPMHPRRAVEAVGYRLVLPTHWLLLCLTWALWLAQRLHLVPRRFGVPRIDRTSLRPLDAPAGAAGLAPSPDTWLFTGCVMDAWLRDTHRSSLAVLRAAGRRVATPGRGGDCCGALHAHAGRHSEAQLLARRVMDSMPGDAPIVVDSAGCGAAMKDYGRLLGTADATRFSARVRDFAEALTEMGSPELRTSSVTVVVQDPCHLRHVQQAHQPTRALLGLAFCVAETDDDGMCCGAGGAYAAQQPALANAIRDRKVAALRRAGGENPVVASANPGCMIHLRAAGIDARHPADLIAERLVDPMEPTDG